MKIKDTLYSDEMSRYDQREISREDFSTVLENLVSDTTVSIIAAGANGEFAVTGRIYRDYNDNIYVGDTCIYRDENRYGKHGGADSELKNLTVSP